MNKFGVGLVAVSTIAAGAVLYSGIGPFCTEKGAHNALKDAVLDRLKSPASAIFVDDAEVEAVSSCFYKFKGSVDSQNSFGAMMRMSYRGSVIDSDYKVISVSVGQ